MPFVLRSATTPTIPTILQLEQIVIVDKTGPSLSFGVAPGAACCVGEFLKGPFLPTEVTSTADLINTFGGLSTVLSQNYVGAVDTVGAINQDGSGVAFEGNGMAHLIGKAFQRLVVQRVDNDAVTAVGGTVKGEIDLTVAVWNPITGTTEWEVVGAATVTSVNMLIPAGYVFKNAGGAGEQVALSQDILIPKGTVVTTPAYTIQLGTGGGMLKLVQDATTGQLRIATAAELLDGSIVKLGPTCFFINAITAAPAAINTVVTAAIPGVFSTITVVNNVVDLYTPGAAAAASLKARIETLYVGTTVYASAIDKTAPTGTPGDQITSIFSARNTVQIRAKLRDACVAASGMGRGRMACMSAPPADYTSGIGNAAATKTAALGLSLAESLNDLNGDRVAITFPYVQIYSSDLSRNIVISAAGFKASLFNQLAEEYQSSVANSYLTSIQAFEPAFSGYPLAKTDYINFKANGISSLLKDRTAGWWFQSAVTAANATNYPTRVFDNRRRFADFVQDSIAAIATKYNKLPGTTERVNALVGELDAFLTSLVSKNNLSQQRMEAYLIDAKSGNTPQLTAVGIWTFIVKCRMLGDLNDLVFETQIGPTVEVSQSA